MHLFHISQVVFIIPRIRPGDKHVTAHRISILSRAPPLSIYIYIYKRARGAHLPPPFAYSSAAPPQLFQGQSWPEKPLRDKLSGQMWCITNSSYIFPPSRVSVYISYGWIYQCGWKPNDGTPSRHCPTFRVICDISDECQLIRGKAACSA